MVLWMQVPPGAPWIVVVSKVGILNKHQLANQIPQTSINTNRIKYWIDKIIEINTFEYSITLNKRENLR